MRPVLVKAPTARPIEPADVIARAEVLSGASVVAIGALIDAATGQLSGWHGTLGRCLVDQAWSVELEPDQRGYYRLPFPDVSQLLAVKDEGGGDLAARFRLRSDALGWYVEPLDGVGTDALTIQFVAGFGGPESVPEPIKQAIVFMVVGMFSQTSETGQIRSETVDGVGATSFNSPEQTMQSSARLIAGLLQPYRVGPRL